MAMNTFRFENESITSLQIKLSNSPIHSPNHSGHSGITLLTQYLQFKTINAC
ncbi:hypothetical protein SynROS8604_01937 [Synechococcus sp. ROS8604]|nr:hypothetical protein SynROS8604_01937 [Synechococcus sp. ROS8604]